MPPLGAVVSTVMELVHTTRTEPGGEVWAATWREGRSSWANRKGPMQLVASVSSWPCFEALPTGGGETPALFQRTSSLDSFLLKASTEALMVLRSSSERGRYSSCPAKEGSGTEALISSMLCRALASERPAR